MGSCRLAAFLQDRAVPRARLEHLLESSSLEHRLHPYKDASKYWDFLYLVDKNGPVRRASGG
jgi:hypothetical protein